LYIFLSTLTARLKDALWAIPFAFLAAGLVWFFGHIIFSTDMSYWLWVRYAYLTLFGLSTLFHFGSLVWFMAVAQRVNASYTDVWEAAYIYKVGRKYFKSAQSFHNALSLAKFSHKVLAPTNTGSFFDEVPRRRRRR
jgi:hypothetical protein